MIFFQWEVKGKTGFQICEERILVVRILDMAAGPWTFKVCSMDQEAVCSNILHISVEGKYFGIWVQITF